MPEFSKKLVIVGAGGFARETLDWALDAKVACPEFQYDRVSFIDDRPDFASFPRLKDHYAGDFSTYRPQKDEHFVIAIGDSGIRSKVDAILKEKAAEFGTLVHPRALISQSAEIQEGAIIAANVIITTDTKIGRHTNINLSTTIGHDATVGNFVTISSHNDIMGGCFIDDFVFLGSGARILPKCSIAPKTRIGAGCTVMRSVKEASVLLNARPKVIKLTSC